MNSEEFNKIKISPLDLVRFKSLRSTTICCCLLGFVIFSMYYGPSLIIDSVGFNTFVTSFALQLSEMLMYIPGYYLIDKLKRQKTGAIAFLCTMVCSFVLIFIEKPENCRNCY